MTYIGRFEVEEERSRTLRYMPATFKSWRLVDGLVSVQGSMERFRSHAIADQATFATSRCSRTRLKTLTALAR
jgi:hypothetical protein